MAQQLLNLGSAANDGTGTEGRAGGDIINDNFTELYGLLNDYLPLAGGTLTGDLTLDANVDINMGGSGATQPALTTGVLQTILIEGGLGQTYTLNPDAGLLTASQTQISFQVSGSTTALRASATNILPGSGLTQSIGGSANEWTNAFIKGAIDPDGVTGLQLGSASTKLIGFWGATAAAQPSSSGENTGYSAVGGTNVNHQDTFTGNVGSTAYTINDIVKHLKNMGLIAL